MSSRKLVVLTSLSPMLLRGKPPTPAVGAEYQMKCVQSWLDAGARLISINSRLEIAMLDGDYPQVEFVQSSARKNVDNPKGLPGITEFLEFGRHLEPGSVFAMVNSDIEFLGDREVLEALFQTSRSGCVFANRHESAPNAVEPGLPYLYGYDLFVVDSGLVSPNELAGFRIGSPWWDYLFLYLLASKKIPLTYVTSPILSHSTHDQAWNSQAWLEGLHLVSRHLRRLSEYEGPVAALLSNICQNYNPTVLASFNMDSISQGLGVVLGTAIVNYIDNAAEHAIWFEDRNVGDRFVPRGRGRLIKKVNASCSEFNDDVATPVS